MKTLTRVYKEKIKVSDSGECCYGTWFSGDNLCPQMQVVKVKGSYGGDVVQEEKTTCKKYKKPLSRFRIGYKRCDECIKDFGY